LTVPAAIDCESSEGFRQDRIGDVTYGDGKLAPKRVIRYYRLKGPGNPCVGRTKEVVRKGGDTRILLDNFHNYRCSTCSRCVSGTDIHLQWNEG
jgi:hypothetical protein